jgi:hypothetical protein
MTKGWAFLTAALALTAPSWAVRADEAATTQTSPLATEPMPTQGGGQVAVGAAVKGSAPGPGPDGAPSPGPAAPSPVDQSQEQQGVLLKPGATHDDMDKAAGEQPKP